MRRRLERAAGLALSPLPHLSCHAPVPCSPHRRALDQSKHESIVANRRADAAADAAEARRMAHRAREDRYAESARQVKADADAAKKKLKRDLAEKAARGEALAYSRKALDSAREVPLTRVRTLVARLEA